MIPYFYDISINISKHAFRTLSAFYDKAFYKKKKNKPEKNLFILPKYLDDESIYLLMCNLLLLLPAHVQNKPAKVQHQS